MKSSVFPDNVIAAATHPDPYPYYADLVANRPLFRDESLGLWVASSASAVSATLTSEIFRVRPAHEPVPRVLDGSAAGKIFRHLIRMNDGAGHCPFNRAVAATLASIPSAQIEQRATHWSQHLLQRLDLANDIARTSELAFKLSSYVVGGLLGVADEHLDQVSQWVGDFVRCIFWSTDTAQIERGKVAAEKLLQLFHSTLEGSRIGNGNILFTLEREAERAGRSDRTTIIANGIGFLTQGYEATAGLIGNTLLRLSIDDDLRRKVAVDSNLLRESILETLRYDPPNHNTRRFVVTDGELLGQRLKCGDAIVVVLAAANRDPAANPEPDRFELRRANRKLFTFGTGVHACSGDTVALSIVQAGVATLLRSGLNIERLRDDFIYRDSPNTRIPLFASKGEHHVRSAG